MLLAYVGNPRRLTVLLKIPTHCQIRILTRDDSNTHSLQDKILMKFIMKERETRCAIQQKKFSTILFTLQLRDYLRLQPEQTFKLKSTVNLFYVALDIGNVPGITNIEWTLLLLQNLMPQFFFN